jgi:predicted secreted hydrolase
MNDRLTNDRLGIGHGITRRALFGGAAALALSRKRARAQGFAGLDKSAGDFAPVTPGRKFTFPADHGPHPDYRIEWWYVTANLVDSSGAAFGAQWTLFRQAMRSGAQQEGWANPQLWMAHAAVTRADSHRFSETFGRGGVGQAGVEASPFRAFIDAWEMRGLEQMRDDAIAPLQLTAATEDFSYALRLDADQALVLQGDAGYSQKSERAGQASYYYSQPFFKAKGSLTIDDRRTEVTGQAWMDREWSSQPLASDQTGWDWFALHFKTGEKLMLYRLRRRDGHDYSPGNWILPDGTNRQIASADLDITALNWTEIAGRRIPTLWRVAIPRLELKIECVPLNDKSWMGTSFAYWEGPISFTGSHAGVGYLEMTGY